MSRACTDFEHQADHFVRAVDRDARQSRQVIVEAVEELNTILPLVSDSKVRERIIALKSKLADHLSRDVDRDSVCSTENLHMHQLQEEQVMCEYVSDEEVLTFNDDDVMSDSSTPQISVEEEHPLSDLTSDTQNTD